MNRQATTIIFSLVLTIIFFSQCNNNDGMSSTAHNQKDSSVALKSYGGFDSQVKWGEHLVILGGCNDCHSPKKMTPMGPVVDSGLLLSGHPAMMPPPNVDRKEMESKGLSVTQTLGAWVGPWGISYASNITSDSTGIGNWTEDQFILCLRKGKWMGLPTARTLLPPMPWDIFKYVSDDEIKAIFAYLESTKPVKNVSPHAVLPVLAH